LIVIVVWATWATIETGCSRFSIEPIIGETTDTAFVKAVGENLMVKLQEQSPEWAVATKNYVEQVLLPKLNDPATDATIGLADEIALGLNLLLDEIPMTDQWRETIKSIIRLATGVSQPGVTMTEYEKAVLRAFGEGLLAGYSK